MGDTVIRLFVCKIGKDPEMKEQKLILLLAFQPYVDFFHILSLTLNIIIKMGVVNPNF